MGSRHKKILTNTQKLELEWGARLIVGLTRKRNNGNHRHDYKLIRKTTAVIRGQTVIYKFYKCSNPGCPEPDKMDIENA
jgi:hypothetical protein